MNTSNDLFEWVYVVGTAMLMAESLYLIWIRPNARTSRFVMFTWFALGVGSVIYVIVTYLWGRLWQGWTTSNGVSFRWSVAAIGYFAMAWVVRSRSIRTSQRSR